MVPTAKVPDRNDSVEGMVSADARATMRTLSLAALAAITSLALFGCGDDAPVSSSEDVTAKATTIAKSLEGPGNLTVVTDRLVWSTAHFVASGDPELDQQFAFWQGELWSKPLGSG